MQDKFRITMLVVELDSAVRELCRCTGEALGFLCLEARDADEALALLHSHSPEIVLTGIKLLGMTGVELLRQIKVRLPRTEIAILTGLSNVDSAEQAIKLGAYRYLMKPMHAGELKLMLRRIEEKIRLALENEYLREKLKNDDELSVMSGASPEIQEVMRTLARVNSSHAPILITGEKGTGKTLVARAIHFRSSLTKRPFVKVNCGALDPALAETELFGDKHAAPLRKDSATRAGRFHAAQGGTLFLSNVSELSPQAQTKLLRVLQEFEAQTAAGIERGRVNVRVIASAHGNVEKAVSEGRLLHGLYSCLKVQTIHMPALRDRSGDIPALVHALIQHHAPHRWVRVSGEAMNSLLQYHWPGNFWEMDQCIKRALKHGDPEMIDVSDLSPEISKMLAPNAAGKHDMPRERTLQNAPAASAEGPAEGRVPRLEEAERAAIEAAMRQAGGDKKAASALLGISRKTLYRKLKSYKMAPRDAGNTERMSLEEVIRKANGDMTSARKLLGVDFLTLYKKMKRHGIPLPPLETTDRATLESIIRQTGGKVAVASKLLGIDNATLFQRLKQSPSQLAPTGSSSTPIPGHRSDRSG